LDLEALRIHHLEPSSRANGPGLRFVVWVQGCSLGCPACFNPETHPKAGGEIISTAVLAEIALRERGNIEGITVSGGEPFQQIQALGGFLSIIREQSNLSTLVFTGFTWKEIQRLPGAAEVLKSIDVLLAGRYRNDLRIAKSLLGSSNKTIYFLSDRYSACDLEEVPAAEILIRPDGTTFRTGIDPLRGTD